LAFAPAFVAGDETISVLEARRKFGGDIVCERGRSLFCRISVSEGAFLADDQQPAL